MRERGNTDQTFDCCIEPYDPLTLQYMTINQNVHLNANQKTGYCSQSRFTCKLPVRNIMK